MRKHCRHLTPASRRQDHTTSPSACARFVKRAAHVHRIPLPTSVTIASAPLWRERDGAGYEVIWVRGEREYFRGGDWTGSIALFARRFFLFGATGFWLAFQPLRRPCERRDP